MRRLVVVVLVVAASCGDAATGTTNTTSTTAGPLPTTTAARPATGAATTATATTTAPITTAGSSGPAVVASSYCVLGWWDDGWVSVSDDNTLAPPVAPGDPLLAATLNGVFPAEVVALKPYDDVGWPAWSLDVAPGLDFGLATAGGWDPVPHLVELAAASSDVYMQQASLIMAQRGYPDVPVELVQVIRTDLEGDGVEEAIVVARHPDAPAFSPEVGVFSLIFLRRLIDGEVQTAILHHSIFTADDVGLATSVENAEVSAVADLNGDSKMEIAIDGYGYEWYWSEVFEYVDDDLGPVSVMVCGGGV